MAGVDNENPLYDEKIIQAMAAKLYSQADSIVRSHTVAGFFLGFLAGLVAGAAAGEGGSWAVWFGVVSAIGGAASGRSKAFSLRVQAQTALCQLQIERNTRGRGAF